MVVIVVEVTGDRAVSNDEWGTPRWLYEALDQEFHFDMDVCASKENHKCDTYFTKEIDALTQEWGESNFCNPPYSDQMPWAEKAMEQALSGRGTVMLAMCDSSTEFFKYCYRNALEIRLINHRIKFDGAKGSPRFASMIVIFNPIPEIICYPTAEIVLVDYREFMP